MAEVQWIKLIVGMFDGNSFKKIKRAKIGGVPFRDKLTAVWFELLDLAGKSNANGYLIDNDEVPYQSFDDIAVMLDRDEKEIELCMNYFLSERMIELIDGVYCISNFIRYQNQDGLERIREQTRKRVAKYREKKLLSQCNDTCNVTVTLRNALDIDKETDLEKRSLNIKEAPVRFAKPSRQEVKEYCIERGGKVDAEVWYDYYESNGWRVGKNAMKDWKAAVRTWEKREEPKSTKRAPTDTPKYGNFDINEAFAAALQRTYEEET